MHLNAYLIDLRQRRDLNEYLPRFLVDQFLAKALMLELDKIMLSELSPFFYNSMPCCYRLSTSKQVSSWQPTKLFLDDQWSDQIIIFVVQPLQPYSDTHIVFQKLCQTMDAKYHICFFLC